MTIKSMIPWRRKEENDVLAPMGRFEDAFLSLQREMNRIFENFFSDFSGLAPRSGFAFSPKVDVTETDTAIKVEAELPGLDEKDLEVTLDGDTLILAGEKKQEKEETRKGIHRLERTYGSFYRRIPLPAEVDADKVEATFHKGVVTINLPKTKVSKAKTIEVKTK